MNTPTFQSEPAKDLSRGMSWGLLFTSTAWMASWIALAINIWHTAVLDKIPSAHAWVLGVVIFMVLAGALGSAMAVDELCRGKNRSVLFWALWLWIASASIGIGSLWAARLPYHWPWLEILLATLLTGALLAWVRLRRLRPAPTLPPEPG